VSLSRFDDTDGMRAEMREDARFVAARYWPVGAGMGNFDEVFQVDESLEYVSPRRAGRAHMDYLELAIEAGVAGALLAAGWLGWALMGGWRSLRRRGAWPARAATLGVFSIAAQSLLAFPLRSQAMLCVAALAIVLVARSPVAAARQAKDAP
jgi:O-antigen ligase